MSRNTTALNASVRDVCGIIQCNNITRCVSFLLPLSNADITTLVNTNIGTTLHPKTPVHVAADEDVDVEIWKLLVPWAYETTICKGPKPPLFRLTYKYSENSKTRPSDWLRSPFTLARQQLEKLKWWLNYTKLSTSKDVEYWRTETLWRLCRIQGSVDPDKVSLEDVRNLAKDMIETYNTSVCLENAECPIHYAMEEDKVCFLSLFLSYQTANANCLLERRLTPLFTRINPQRRQFYLPSIGLLIEHGAQLGYEDRMTGIKAYHVVLLQLTPKELDIFMAKYHKHLEKAIEECHFLPLIQGLIFHAETISLHRNNRQMMELDILRKIQILYKYNFSFDARDFHGRRPMHYVCWFKYPTIFEYLLSKGLKQDETDTFGRGCLYYAISQPISGLSNLIKVDHLIRTLQTVVSSLADASPKTTDDMGRTALHFACFESNRTALECLNKAGFEIDVVDKQGKTPLNYVCEEFRETTNELRSMSTETISRKENSHHKSLTTASEYLITGKMPCNKTVEDNNCNLEKDLIAKGIPRMVTSERLLTDPKFGVLNEADATYMYIKQDIQRLINKLAKKLRQIEPRFQSKVHLAGSVSEGTNLQPPNEFDFQFHLTKISHCFVINELKSGNDVSLGIKHPHNCDPLDKDLLQPGGSVNRALFNAFHSAVYKIVGNSSFWEDLPFYWHHHNLSVSAARGRVFSKDTLTAPFRLKWVGLQQSDIDISVDLVPIIVIDWLPDNALSVISDKIINFVDKANLKWHIVCRDSDDGRLSFFPIEKYILCRLMPELRQSYTLAKAVSKYCCEKFSLDSNYITSYMLKNALFCELDPNLNFSLVASELMVCEYVNQFQANVLSTMKETLNSMIANTGTSFIQRWTWKIFDRLERWFASEDGVHVYCRPSETFPDIIVVDLESEDPQLKSLKIFKEMFE